MKSNSLMIILVLVIYLIFTGVPTTRALHMFQQNRYESGRYFAWLKKQMRTTLSRNMLPLASIVILIVLEFILDRSVIRIITILVVSVWACLLLYDELKKEYIKPLVYTDRVKRQLFALTLLNVVVLFFLYSYTKYWDIWGLIYSYYGVWVMIFVMAVLTTPIENSVKKKYLLNAADILKSHKQLVKIGITGSYGKTSSKTILQEILSEKFYSLMTPGSYNTPMGITRTIREMMKPIHEVFICEMGADHVGDIKELCEFVHPRIGLVTSIGPQHLNTFGSIENIINEKMFLIESLPDDGLGIINKDNEFIRNYVIKNNCRLVSYGIHEKDVDYYATKIKYSPKGSKFKVVTSETTTDFETKLLGEHNIANICAAIAIARELGVEWKELQQAVKKAKYVEHRLELKKINGYTFVDNAFNSNPVGSAMSLEVMKTMPNKRFVITPGMIDLGKRQDELNKEFGRKMMGCVDVAILVGIQQTKPIVDGLQEIGFDMDQVYVCKTVREAFQLMYTLATTVDTILLENDLPDAFNI